MSRYYYLCRQALNSISVELSLDFSEFIVIQLMSGNGCFMTIAAVYRSPSSTTANDQKLNEVIEHLVKHCTDKLLIVGDFNFCNIDWNTWTTQGSSVSSKFLDCLRENFLAQLVCLPTRARGTNTPHILDLVAYCVVIIL